MEDVLHAVLLPWSAFGHMMPFFELATALAESGLHVILVQTPRNIERLPEVPSHLKPLMTLLALPMPQLDLPNGAEAKVDVPFEKVPLLKIAYDLLQHPFEEPVSEQSPTWIIMESLMSPPHWINFPSSVAYKKYEAKDVFLGYYGPNCNEFFDAERTAKILDNCQAISLRTCNEFEGPYLDLLRKILDKPVTQTGLLPPKGRKQQFSMMNYGMRFSSGWIKKFVGFGSECMLSKEEVREIAYGLELSGVPSIWALRKPNLLMVK